MTVQQLRPADEFDLTEHAPTSEDESPSSVPGLNRREVVIMNQHLDRASQNLTRWEALPDWEHPASAEALSGAALSLVSAGLLAGISFLTTLANGQKVRARELKVRERELELRARELDLAERELELREQVAQNG